MNGDGDALIAEIDAMLADDAAGIRLAPPGSPTTLDWDYFYSLHATNPRGRAPLSAVPVLCCLLQATDPILKVLDLLRQRCVELSDHALNRGEIDFLRCQLRLLRCARAATRYVARAVSPSRASSCTVGRPSDKPCTCTGLSEGHSRPGGDR